MTTQLLTEYLSSNNIAHKVDMHPTPAKVNKIQRAIDRKKALLDLSVNAYKQVRGAK